MGVKRWFFRTNILAVIAGFLMIAAMFLPWWSFTLQFSGQTDLYPYLISGPGSELVGYKRSPQMMMLTGVLITAIILCLMGSVLRGKLARGMLAASGLFVFLAAWRLLVRVESVAARFDIPIQGQGVANYQGFAMIEVSTWLRPGLYLVLAGGLLSIVAAILYNRLRLRFEGWV